MFGPEVAGACMGPLPAWCGHGRHKGLAKEYPDEPFRTKGSGAYPWSMCMWISDGAVDDFRSRLDEFLGNGTRAEGNAAHDFSERTQTASSVVPPSTDSVLSPPFKTLLPEDVCRGSFKLRLLPPTRARSAK